MLLAAVDLGSNSFRMEIGEVVGERIVSRQYHKEYVRLAGGFDADGRITPQKQAESLAALERFAERLKDIPPEQVRAVGTQALRVARNIDEFLPAACAALGHPIEVIAGREEARLVFSGCAHTLPVSGEKRLVVDIGGGSTEVVTGRGYTAHRCESFHVGCVNTSIDFFADGRITETAMREAQLSAQAEFIEAARMFDSRTWDAAYGSAGTISAVADIGTASGLTNGVVTPALLKRLRTELVELGAVQSIRLPGLKEDRREVIAGGIAVLSAVFETFGVRQMTPALGALRVGLLYDLLDRKNQQDVRDKTVAAIVKRSDVDKQQAARVAALADTFLVTMGVDDQNARKLLQWAAMLHETGKLISPSRYHRHSEYIVRNADMPGFSRADQKRMATLVLGQRGNLGKVREALADPLMVRMLIALRLAVITAQARRTTKLPEWSLGVKAPGARTCIEIGIDPAWIARHPLSAFLFAEEARMWERVGASLTLNGRALADGRFGVGA
jgi:exopolyphosphatase/guanosine-5'-triphosphate,3'-diphosphate pyrophosphatase